MALAANRSHVRVLVYGLDASHANIRVRGQRFSEFTNQGHLNTNHRRQIRRPIWLASSPMSLLLHVGYQEFDAIIVWRIEPEQSLEHPLCATKVTFDTAHLHVPHAKNTPGGGFMGAPRWRRVSKSWHQAAYTASKAPHFSAGSRSADSSGRDRKVSSLANAQRSGVSVIRLNLNLVPSPRAGTDAS